MSKLRSIMANIVLSSYVYFTWNRNSVGLISLKFSRHSFVIIMKTEMNILNQFCDYRNSVVACSVIMTSNICVFVYALIEKYSLTDTFNCILYLISFIVMICEGLIWQTILKWNIFTEYWTRYHSIEIPYNQSQIYKDYSIH